MGNYLNIQVKRWTDWKLSEEQGPTWELSSRQLSVIRRGENFTRRSLNQEITVNEPRPQWEQHLCVTGSLAVRKTASKVLHLKLITGTSGTRTEGQRQHSDLSSSWMPPSQGREAPKWTGPTASLHPSLSDISGTTDRMGIGSEAQMEETYQLDFDALIGLWRKIYSFVGNAP